jgi:plastocyanin
MRLLRQPYSGREMTENTSAFTPVRPSSERGGLIVPAILIALGGLFLLGNAGVIAPLSVRSVLSLWPLLLVLAGIQMVLGRDRPSLALGLQLGALALGVALLLARAYVAPFDVRIDASEQGASPAIAGASEVVVTATDIHFSVSELHLPAGAVNLTLRNDGVLRHDLTISALGVHIAADSGRTVTTGLRNLPKGHYDGFCSVSGHADAGMRLAVIVD